MSHTVCFLYLELIYFDILDSNSQLYIDLNKNKTDCKKLIEKSSKETEMNILKLKNRVDKFEKKLSDVSLLLSLALNLEII